MLIDPTLTASAVVSKDGGHYACLACGDEWQHKDVYRWWPVRIGWRPGGCKRFFGRHGFQIGGSLRGRVFGHTIHVGALKIIFGKDAHGDDGAKAPPSRGAK